jgi:maleylacetate reductase
MMHGEYRYIAQEKVIFGRPMLEALAQLIGQRGAQRVMIVSGKSLAQKTSLVADLVKGLGDRCIGVFDGCAEHAPRETVIALTRELREKNVDLVVTLGGGSPIDTVKVALLCLTVGVTSEKEMDDWHVKVGADGKAEAPNVPMGTVRQVAIPTTLSGAEFSDMGGSTEVATGMKHAFIAPASCPVAVILDPTATVHTPERLWLSTGIRAVDHAVEALCSITAQPMTDAVCIEALRRLAQSLPVSRAKPDDMDARLDSQLGVWLASSSINRAEYGASHGMGHVLGAALGTPHGITSCVLLPGVLAFNEPATRAQQRRIADALGASSASEGVRNLISSLGLPTRLSDIMPDKSRFPEYAKKSLSNRWVRTNPVKIDTEEQAMRVLEAAW